MTATKEIIPGFDISDEIVIFAKDQPEYLQLPAWKSQTDDGRIVARFKLTWKERFSVFFGGSIWLNVLTFNHPLQPVKLETSCPLMGHMGYDKEI